MADNLVYALTCTDLGFSPVCAVPEAVAGSIKQDIEAARAALEDMGIVVYEDNPDHVRGLVMYAGWLYRGRSSSEPMPTPLDRWLRRHRVNAAKGGAI